MDVLERLFEDFVKLSPEDLAKKSPQFLKVKEGIKYSMLLAHPEHSEKEEEKRLAKYNKTLDISNKPKTADMTMYILSIKELCFGPEMERKEFLEYLKREKEFVEADFSVFYRSKWYDSSGDEIEKSALIVDVLELLQDKCNGKPIFFRDTGDEWNHFYHIFLSPRDFKECEEDAFISVFPERVGLPYKVYNSSREEFSGYITKKMAVDEYWRIFLWK